MTNGRLQRVRIGLHQRLMISVRKRVSLSKALKYGLQSLPLRTCAGLTGTRRMYQEAFEGAYQFMLRLISGRALS
jgi:hypothetical protein